MAWHALNGLQSINLFHIFKFIFRAISKIFLNCLKENLKLKYNCKEFVTEIEKYCLLYFKFLWILTNVWIFFNYIFVSEYWNENVYVFRLVKWPNCNVQCILESLHHQHIIANCHKSTVNLHKTEDCCGNTISVNVTWSKSWKFSFVFHTLAQQRRLWRSRYRLH